MRDVTKVVLAPPLVLRSLGLISHFFALKNNAYNWLIYQIPKYPAAILNIHIHIQCCPILKHQFYSALLAFNGFCSCMP